MSGVWDAGIPSLRLVRDAIQSKPMNFNRYHATTRPRSVFWSLVSLAMAVVLLAVLGTPAEGRVIGRSAETSIGRETASVVERYFTVDTDPVAVARVRRIGRRLAGAAKDAPYPFEFHVVEAPEINAFALPGGFIYVFRGLLQIVPNDDALAFIMAHEVSHVTRRHAIRQFEKNVLLGAAISGILAGTGARGFGDAALVVQQLSSLSFTRTDEKDADHQGIELLAAAGYNVRAASEAMLLIKRAAGDDKGIPDLLRSHPAPDDRVKKLGELANEISARRSAAAAKAPPLPAAPLLGLRKIAGLEAVEIASNEWFPLRTGGRWVYRVESAGAETTLTVRCLEPVAAEPSGIFRVEYDLGGAARSTRLLVTSATHVLGSIDRADLPVWRNEAIFDAEKAPSGWRVAGLEMIRVPAGEWEALKVERVNGTGDVESASWYVRGVGLVRTVTPGSRTTRELVSHQLPVSPFKP